ncbi:uncharacterized protein LOC125676249 isoform X2 [Ostrea edulis]|uniref:uncharacterized protein LOC125676249 isoform X2 n=1 Tax=Ostrea edulis TaxID=37623 RepID=UPI0024AEA242|nr:uncharacterized protein LOC125676249 isoform X2 [Ostrea edulis]
MASKYLVPEQQNFVRLSLACVDEIREVLGDILHSQIPPENLLKEIQANRTLLIGYQKLSPEQLKLCYIPGPLVPNYQCFDITLLYKLIRNLCSTLKPTRGWGEKPHPTDIKLGDDIERLRFFRNKIVAHAEISSVPDDVFDSKWNELENTFTRIYGFSPLKGNKEGILRRLACIKRADFGWQEYEKSQLRLMFEYYKFKDAPKLTIKGDERKICGEMACFEARYANGDMSNNWPITWQRIRGSTTEQLDIGTERYRGSSSQMLVIARVSKEDQGEYRATVLREVNGTHVQIPSNSIYLTVTGDLPILEIEKAISEDDRITIHYNVSIDDQSPAVHSVLWTKDGTRLDTNADKYSGGQFIDRYLTMHSPASTDIGQYNCEVFNAVGSVTKSIDLNLPSVSIAEDLQVAVGNPVIIKATIQSCPTSVSAIWQKNGKLDLEDFENLDIDDFKYLGSKNDPEDPILVIPKTTPEDGIYYRILVSNGMGQRSSNIICLKVIGDVPSLNVHHETSVLERSVTLVCKMVLPINSPNVSDVCWTKDDIKIDILRNGEKYSGGSIVDPSLTIKDVNSNDEGRYQCCASNLMGNMWSEKIHLGLPTIEFDNPDLNGLHEGVTYNAAIKSIPVALRAEWKVRQEPSGDFQVIDTHNPLYRGSTVALPRPRLVVNIYGSEQLQSFQLEVFNFIGSSRRDTYDQIMDSSGSNINQEVSDPLKNFYKKRGSTVLFANLSNNLAKSIPEDKLDVLKHILLGLGEVDMELIKKVKSIREMFILLQENKLFTQTDVILMQYLLKQAECKDLNNECIKYARKQRSLCFFEKPPDNGFKHVQIHVEGDVKGYSNEDIQKIRETVVAFLGCEDSDVVIDGIHHDKSFVVVLAIKETLVNNMVHMDQQHIEKLCNFKVDYFILYNKTYSMEGLLKDGAMADVPGPSTAPYFSPRKETENFSRLCQLIMTICSDLFRDILSRYIKPAGLRLELDNNRTKLERIMNAQQKEQIYPPSGTTTLTSKDLDISVLYILLRNICKIPKHQNGWGNPPLDTDTRLAACIERIRIQRNLISAHSTIGEIEDTVFQDHWDKLKNSILEIEKQLIGGDMYARGVDELLSCDLNPTRAEKYVKEFKNIQEKMENFESSLKTTRYHVAVKRVRMKIERTHKRQLAVKKARLDKLERQSSDTSQGIHETLTTVQGRMAALEENLQARFVSPERNQARFVSLERNQGNEGYTRSQQTLPNQKQDHDNGEEGPNILHEACKTGVLETCEYLIQTYPDLLHSVNNHGDNAALHAVRGGNVKILQLLADNEVDVKHKSNDGWNILYVACVYSNLEMSRYIIQTYPDLLHSVDNARWNAALYAARGGNVKILQLLADNEVDVRHKNNDGWNILHAACVYSNLEMSRYIIQTYPDLLHSVDNARWNAALYAARGGNVKILQLLADNEVDVRHKNNDGWNILHAACVYSNLKMSRYIIQTYPDLLHIVDNDGCNAALHSAAGGNVKILQLLADNEVDVKHKANNGWNILNVACVNANLEMSRYIIQTYPDLLHSVDNDGGTAALHAARGGNVKILQLLADNEVDVKHKANDGWNILNVACVTANLEMSRYIIQTYPDLLHSVVNDGWNAALHAARGGNVKILQLLADNEVDVKHKNNNGWNILHTACIHSNLEMSRYIIQTYPDLLHSVDNARWNAALYAARGGNVKILQLLADNEVDVRHKANNGWNILHAACFNANLEMSRYIIQTYPDLLHSVDNDGWNAALYAARGGNVKILQLLADDGVKK